MESQRQNRNRDGKKPAGLCGLSDDLPPQQLACRYRGSGRGFGDAARCHSK